jgi:hypothetical protein
VTTLKEMHDPVFCDPQAPDDLIKRIRKLRWIGMEEEARKLEASLRGYPRSDVVLTVPGETDY